MFYNILLYLTLILVFITNDSARVYSIPIGKFHIIEREIFLYSLYFLFTINILIKKKLYKGIFYKEILTILFVYLLFVPLGILNNNALKGIGYNLRQVFFILIYFPMIYFFKLNKNRIYKILKIYFRVEIISVILFLIVFVLFSGNKIYIRGIFFWIEPYNNLLRVLFASSYYLPLLLFILFAFYFYKNKYIKYILLFLLGLLITFTRSLWISFLLGYFYFITISFLKKNLRYKTVFYLLFFIIIIIVYLINFKSSFFDNISERFKSSTKIKSMSLRDRIEESENFYKKFKKKPLFGFGTGTLVRVKLYSFGKYLDTPFSHNTYMVYLVNFGVIGTLLIILTYGIILLKNTYFIFTTKKRQKSLLLISFTSGFISLLSAALVTGNLSVASGFFLLGIILALSSAVIEN